MPLATINYVHCDIPPGVTVEAYRRSRPRLAAAPHRFRLPRVSELRRNGARPVR